MPTKQSQHKINNSFSNSIKSSILSWTTKDVEQWLYSLDLGKFVHRFCKQNGIDGLTLLLMKEDDLRQAPLAIERLVDIKKLWYHIRILQCKHQDFYSPLNISTACIFNDNDEQINLFKLFKQGSFYDNSINHNHSSSSPTHLLESNVHNIDGSCQVHSEQKPNVNKSQDENRKLLVSFIYALISGIWTSFIMIVVHNRVPNVQNLIPQTAIQVPGHHLDCTPRAYGTSREILFRCVEIFLFQGLSIQGVRSCGDYMFSGHTVMLTLLNHCITEYTTSDFYVIHLLSWFCNIFGMILILAAHEHYSIDVFIAFFLTSRLFLYYHSLANNVVLHSRSDNRLSIWYPMFSYFEKNVQCMVPNIFRIPWPLTIIFPHADSNDEEKYSSANFYNDDCSNDKRKRK
ncbi:unnamed protein product [Rotaria socialis]|uniref:SAM domain-containing protein n=1 Tax=Rotaria socialis TaxID=392032 RepID=A0A820P4K7_9BILA|nr:unnamed protein product [Rotaria socialis]